VSRFRLDPTPAQAVVLREHCAHARFVWNLAVEQHALWRPGRKPAPGYTTQSRQLTEARADNTWLAEGSQTVQQQALRDFARALAQFFAGTHGWPTWRKAGRHEGFQIVGRQARRVERVSKRTGRVWVPKAGWVAFRWSRRVPDAKSYRVTLDRAGRWHIAFAAIPDPVPAPGNGSTVGVDRGIAVSAALSTGELLKAPGLRKREAERLLRLQRRLAGMTPGSRRRARTKAVIAKLKAREADRRRDWVEQTTTRLARSFDVIVVEDLKIAKMTRSAKGSFDSPGRNVAAKAALNRGILTSGWGELARRLGDKAPGRIVKVDPAYTSQTCHRCGRVDANSRESQAEFACTSCGNREHADVNAARNIAARARDVKCATDSSAALAAGHAVTARGGFGSPKPVNREPQPTLAPSLG
jgi:transposase